MLFLTTFTVFLTNFNDSIPDMAYPSLLLWTKAYILRIFFRSLISHSLPPTAVYFLLGSQCLSYANVTTSLGRFLTTVGSTPKVHEAFKVVKVLRLATSPNIKLQSGCSVKRR